MDNVRLARLRREYYRGKITVGEIKHEVIWRCQTMRAVSVHEEMGDELELIQDKGLRNFTYTILERLPRYFWHVPASILGFHDLKSDNQMGGLVRHSRKVAKVASKIVDPYNMNHYADDFVVAGLLHDSLKYGLDGSIPKGHDHATFAAHWLESQGIFNDRPHIRNMVRTHLGRWGKVVPKSDVEWAFHLADYVVSRGASPSIKVNGHDWSKDKDGF